MNDSENPIDGVADKLRIKVRQLYSFLKEANQIQFRPVRRLTEQQYSIRMSDMPKHPSASLYRPVKLESSSDVPDVLIRVSRPKLTRCPAPPDSCAEWMLPGWDDPNIEPEVAESKNYREVEIDEDGKEVEVTKTIAFADEQTRVKDLAVWMADRKKWVEPELLARRAMRYFESFYTLYAKIEKEGEKLELLIADGMLSWATESAINGSIKI